MTSLILCLLSFVISYVAGRRSLVAGLGTLLGVGYSYGIVRANVMGTFSHFIFDAGVAGLYLAQLFRPLSPAQRFRTQQLKPWVTLVIAWPTLLFFIPIQDPLIQFVGLRGNVFLLPFLLIGARLEPVERYQLALWIGALNIAAFALACAEFYLGVERFFPHSVVTQLIYISNDVAGYTALRIPSSFVTAHVYGGTMVMTIPLLAGAWAQKHSRVWHGQLLMVALVTSLLGVLMCAARLPLVIALVLLVVATYSIRMKVTHLLGWLIMLLGIGWVVSGEERLQRFQTLQDTDFVAERISSGVNMTFFELAVNYPFGNGLGGGGTSIPYFLYDRIKDPVLMENEYARIMLEQGVLGLFIWMAFIVWVAARPGAHHSDPWHLGRRLAWFACVTTFASGLIGIGLLTSVPQTCLLLLNVSWIATHQPFYASSMSSVSRHSELKGPVLASHYGKSA